MGPLRRLTRRDTEWQWTEEQENTFKEVKKLVTAAPILSYCDPKEELVIQCNTSQKGLGAALLQKENLLHMPVVPKLTPRRDTPK